MLRLRPATTEDARFIWECRNDHEARAMSGSTGEIPYGDHCRWLAERLHDPTCTIQIAETSDGYSVGYGRLTHAGSEATISVAVYPVLRRMGFGHQIISVVSHDALTNDTERIVAWIRPENVGSRKAFAFAGYRQIEIEEGMERWELAR